MTALHEYENGDWYEEQFSDESSPYRSCYKKDMTDWIFKTNLMYVDFIVMAYSLTAGKDKILDLGSGTGWMVTCWEYRGFEVIGLEVSAAAVELSEKDNIIVGSAFDLSMFKDDEFTLVTSNQFLEHVTDINIINVIKQTMRIAKYSAHYVAHEKGNDPSHINIKPYDDWVKFFTRVALTNKYMYYRLPFMFSAIHPLHMFFKELPHTAQHMQHINSVFPKQGVR